MTNLLKWSTASSWANAFLSSDLSALANGGAVLSGATAVSNGAVDVMADLSFIMVTSTMSPVSGGGLDFYLLPQLHDSATYADGITSTTAAAQATATYFIGRMLFRAQATSTQNGMLRGIVIPNGTFKWYVINSTGVALPTTTTNMTCQYRTYGENLNG